MALRGVWQLQKLIVNYCDWGGSSRGIREQKPTGNMCEEYGPGRDSSTCNKTKKLDGKKGGETENSACNSSP
ncbi:hypothetical protein TIFTF001_005853 [Ficus carica]|uniref:Uncharacterized protein n=1 Tax=Ficus carica TaxID=3494 RepID=A0AA88CVC2_FICCA|nr:hypothetical protein TIFTF001_005853 [Ficus carica]